MCARNKASTRLYCQILDFVDLCLPLHGWKKKQQCLIRRGLIINHSLSSSSYWIRQLENVWRLHLQTIEMRHTHISHKRTDAPQKKQNNAKRTWKRTERLAKIRRSKFVSVRQSISFTFWCNTPAVYIDSDERSEMQNFQQKLISLWILSSFSATHVSAYWEMQRARSDWFRLFENRLTCTRE